MKPKLIDKQLLLRDSIHIKQVEVAYLDTPFHFHNSYELVWVQQSSGYRIVGDHIENFTDNDLILMGPNLPHVWYNEKDYYHPNHDQQVKAVVAYFKPDWLSESTLNSAELSRLRELLAQVKRGIKITGRTREKIISLVSAMPDTNSLERIISILSILNILTESGEYECLSSSGYVNAYNQKDVEKIDRVYQYIMRNYTDKITLNEVAQVASMTPTAFCKYFKNRTQKTFAHFVNEVRVGYACKLLYNEELPVTEICYKAGFYNPTNFNKNFKLFTKVNPTEFRNNLRHSSHVGDYANMVR